ncbi:MAG: PilZ domain-containing protein [Deltaproteobacteria bacterium]|jgi:c-di-GMP-binding flagellar brake protein YcgR|nr:PilZ domain-containing protein [Deltaproteobacteria bacterium]
MSNKGVTRRKHKRFQAPQGVFVGVGPDFVKTGLLRDISMGGLSFGYVGNGEASVGSYVELFMAEGDFYLGNLLIDIVSNIELVGEIISNSDETLRRCSVKFNKLTPQQGTKLQEFVDKHAVGEA